MSVRQDVVQPGSTVQPVSLLGLLPGRVDAPVGRPGEVPREAGDLAPLDDWDDVVDLARSLNVVDDVVFIDRCAASRVAS